MRTARIEAFSDGVFAIAITLLVLEIRPPEDLAHLPHELAQLWPSYVAYVVSFGRRRADPGPHAQFHPGRAT
jgi:uncharacterized membrane protein